MKLKEGPEGAKAIKRKTLAIRGTFETSEDESLETDFIQVTNDIESTYCQPCAKYRTKVDSFPTEKDEIIKTQNTFREQTNQLLSHIEIFTANLQNLENNIKPMKPKTKSTEMYPGTRKMIESARRLDPINFLAIFKLLRNGCHCENTKFYDSHAKRELKKHTQNVKLGTREKFSATDQFFI